MSSARIESDESSASRFLSSARSRLALKPLTTTLSTGAAPPPTPWGTCSTAWRMKGRRTINPLLPSATTSRSVPLVSRLTACWAFNWPEMAGARRPSTDSGVNRMLSPVFCATLRRASDMGCSCREIRVSCAAAAALIDRAATLPNRIERKPPQRVLAMMFPSGCGRFLDRYRMETFGPRAFPTPLYGSESAVSTKLSPLCRTAIGSSFARDWAKAPLSPTRYMPLTFSPATLGSTSSRAVE